jgi:hypothetical protein
MGIRVRRFPEYGVELHIRSGELNTQDQIRYFQSLGSEDTLAAACAWLGLPQEALKALSETAEA